MGNPAVSMVAAAKPYAGGGVYFGTLTTALPVDATSALNVGHKALGYVSEDGIQPARDTSIERIAAFGGDVVAALLSGDERRFQFTLLEVFSKEVNEFVYGTANVTWTAAVVGTGSKVAVQDKAYKPDQCVIIFELKHGGKRRRIVVPVADPVVVGEEPYADGNLSAYTIEVTCLKNSAGVRVFDYMQNDDAL